MLSLPELQARFAAAVFGDSTEPSPAWIHADGIAGELRLDIYRNNLQEGFIKTLGLEFPVIQRLVGEDYFRQLALTFLARHPSRSGDLYHVGAPFPGFLRHEFASTPYEYFGDVAALEWAWQECLIAEADDALSPQELQAIAPQAYPRLQVALRKAARLLTSTFPIARIWEANQPEATGADAINLADGPEFVVVYRVTNGARIAHLSAGEFALLSSLARGEPLEAALDGALVCEPRFDLALALRRAFELRLFVRLQIAKDCS